MPLRIFCGSATVVTEPSPPVLMMTQEIDMAQEQIRIRTDDGECRAFVIKPDHSNGPWPAVIVYMDALGIRPAILDMSARLAAAGYVVLVPDLFYRFGEYEPMVPKVVFATGFQAITGPLRATTNTIKVASDTRAYIAWLAGCPDVRPGKIGVAGFCMGGGMALMVAGSFPGEIGACACFHAGNLMTDQVTSPHRVIPHIKGEVYIAGADNDNSYPPEMAASVEKELATYRIRHRCETYTGKTHGWMLTDFPVYDHEAAERGWQEMLALFARNLQQAG